MGLDRDIIVRYIILFFILFYIPVYAQTQVSGKVSTVSGESLAGTSVIIKDNSGKIIAYTISTQTGDYLLNLKAGGEYTIEANFLGYEKGIVSISLKESEKAVKNFVLQISTQELKEVVIEYQQPVKLKGDTLVYDAKALAKGTEVVVEDLLKNIPGITIQKDGTILFGDTPIEKVMVDGDDLFNKGYSLLTRNMPSKPLDKIEVLQNYSNNKLLKGIEDSKAVALNLTVQDEYKNLWFGDLMAGYGIEERYIVSGNLMNFGEKYKAFLITSLNNAGYDRVGNITNMVYNSGDMETLGRGTRAIQVMNLSAKTPRLSEDRTRFNNAEMATLSTIFPLSPKTKLKLVGFLGFDELKAYQNSYSVTDFGTTYFENTESNNSANNIKKGYVNAFFNYDVSATKMLQLSSTFNSGNSDFKNDLTFNGVSTKEQLETKSTYFDQKLTYTHKWKERNVVLLKGRFFTDKLPQYYTINDYLMGDLFPYENINAIDNTIGSQKEYAGLEADFKLKQKNGDLLEFTAGFDNSNDNLSTQFRLFTDDGTITPDGYQSDSGYNVGDLYARSGYKFKFDKVSLGLHADVHQLFNRFENMQGEVKRQNPFFINPFLTAGWEVSPDNTISTRYQYSFSNIGALQVNDAYILKSSRSFSKGLGYFDQLENWSAGLSYSTRHYLNRYGLTTGIDYSKQNDAIAYRSNIDQNSSLSEAFLIKAGDRIAATVRTHYVIRKLKGTVGFDASLSRLVYYNEVNNSDLRKNTSYNQIYGLNWASNFKSFFNFKLGTEWTLSNVKSDHNFNSSYAFSFLDLDFAISKQFMVKTKTEYYFFGGEGVNNSYFFADAEANYSFAKDKYTIGLDARNLFDTHYFTTYSVSDIGYSSNSYKLLPRYILLTFKFRF